MPHTDKGYSYCVWPQLPSLKIHLSKYRFSVLIRRMQAMYVPYYTFIFLCKCCLLFCFFSSLFETFSLFEKTIALNLFCLQKTHSGVSQMKAKVSVRTQKIVFFPTNYYLIRNKAHNKPKYELYLSNLIVNQVKSNNNIKS